MENKTTPKHSLIIQANQFVLGRQAISIVEKRTLNFGAEGIDTAADNPRRVKRSFAELIDFVGKRNPKNWKGKKSMIKKIFLELNANPVEIEDIDEHGNRIYRMINWLQSLNYNEATGEIEFLFSEDIMPFLLYVKGQPYAKTFNRIGNYQNIYAVRMMELLETHRWKFKQGKISYVDFDIDKQKWHFGLENQYDRTYDFKKRVIHPAQKELKRQDAPVQFTYDTINKHGDIVQKKVTGLRFYPLYKHDFYESSSSFWETKSDSKPVLVIEQPSPKPLSTSYKGEFPKIHATLMQWGMSETAIQEKLLTYTIEAIKGAVGFVDQSKNTRNKAGLFIKALENGWKSALIEQLEKDKEVSQKRQQLNEKKEAIEKEMKRLRKEHFQKEKTILDMILNTDKKLYDIYDMALEELKEKNPSQLRRYPSDAKECYQNALKSGIITKKIRELFRDKFVELDAEYLPKIEALEKNKD